jgi:hypothetical protein
LAITKPVETDLLVIDGWLPTYQLDLAALEFRRGHYSNVLAVRAVYDFEELSPEGLRGDYVAAVLRKSGIPAERLHSVLYRGTSRDRTYYSAIAVGEWMRLNDQHAASLNLVTDGPHARRSRLLYEEALGRHIAIGVIGLKDPAYDSDHWWRTSEGVREVLFEGIAYFYVKLFFSKPDDRSESLASSVSLSSPVWGPASFNRS